MASGPAPGPGSGAGGELLALESVAQGLWVAVDVDFGCGLVLAGFDVQALDFPHVPGGFWEQPALQNLKGCTSLCFRPHV